MQIGEVASFQNGYAFKSKDFVQDGKYKIIKIKELKDGKVRFFNDSASVNVDDERIIEKYIAEKGDVLFALTGDPVNKNNPLSWVGRVSVYEDDQLALLNQRVCKLVPKERLNAKYIYYYFRAFDNFYALASIAKGSASQANISTKDIEAMEIALPSLNIQNKIVSVLDSIEEKINQNNKINKNLEQQAVVLFRSWFTTFCLSSNKPRVNSEFGEIPEDFAVVKVGSLPMLVTDYVANGSFASLKANVNLYQEPNYAYFIRNTDLKSGSFSVFVDQHSYEFLSKSTLYGGEIIISNVGDVGSVFLCPKLDGRMTLGNNIIMLRPEDDHLRYYLYIWFKYLQGQALIQGIKGGSAQPKFNKTDFKNTSVLIPPKDILTRFHETVAPMFEMISQRQTEIAHLADLRDTLLPKLMSGEIDVSDLNL